MYFFTFRDCCFHLLFLFQSCGWVSFLKSSLYKSLSSFIVRINFSPFNLFKKLSIISIKQCPEISILKIQVQVLKIHNLPIFQIHRFIIIFICNNFSAVRMFLRNNSSQIFQLVRIPLPNIFHVLVLKQ